MEKTCSPLLNVLPIDVLLNMILENDKLDARDIIAFSGTCKSANELIHQHHDLKIHMNSKPAHYFLRDRDQSIVEKWTKCFAKAT